MQEKELRLAIVLTGGVSLAVYMHGVMKELLKLVRASKVYHAIEPEERANQTYRDLNDDPARETDTEEVYFDLIKAMAPEVNLRVLVDVIAGASAGGVNGIFLGRALAHDLPLDAHRTMWLQHADVLELMDERTSARPWSKLYLDIVIRGLFSRRMHAIAPEKETRYKLRRFLRSRWFHPPFSGERYCSRLLDACNAMETGRNPDSSLLPEGHELELLVSITDFDGHDRAIPLHDPPMINEPEHRHLLRFHYVRSPGGTVVTDFNRDGIPGLVFAARATSSFPGAFPPASLHEIDCLLSKRGESWAARERFITDKLAPFAAIGRDTANTIFIDGSIVMNKPFAAAITALSGRPAHREVIRRVIFVDPDPEYPERRERTKTPGMFRTILAAMIEIPAHDPVGDDLEKVDERNRRIRLLRRVVDLARPGVSKLVDQIVAAGDHEAPSVAQFKAWRQDANDAAALGSGFAYDSYFRLKILTVLDRIERIIQAIATRAGKPISSELLRALIKDWIELQGTAISGADSVNAAASTDRSGDIQVLRIMDVGFRVRRLRFVIRRLNELYRPALDGSTPETERLDELKTTLFRLLGEVRRLWQPHEYGSDVTLSVVRLAEAVQHSKPETAKYLNALMEALSSARGLVAFDEEVDEVFSIMVLNYLDPLARHELVAAYLGFSFFDVLTFPMLQSGDFDELEEILIDRISPEDANAIRRGSAAEMLKGTGLRHFGAFFNRAYRENDYLWGRLTAADRLVDIVTTALDGVVPSERLQVTDLKQRLFEKILNAEEPFLKTDPDLLVGIREEIASKLR